MSINSAEITEEPMLETEAPLFKGGLRRSNTEILQRHDIVIRFLSGRGCIISVGCKKIAFEDNQKAMEAINAYVANSYEESEKWQKFFNQ